jgi:hypothetical protein
MHFRRSPYPSEIFGADALIGDQGGLPQAIASDSGEV